MYGQRWVIIVFYRFSSSSRKFTGAADSCLWDTSPVLCTFFNFSLKKAHPSPVDTTSIYLIPLFSLSSFVRFDQQFFILWNSTFFSRRSSSPSEMSILFLYPPFVSGVSRCFAISIVAELPLLVSFKQIQIWMFFNIYPWKKEKELFRVSSCWLCPPLQWHTTRNSWEKNAEKLLDQWILYGVCLEPRMLRKKVHIIALFCAGLSFSAACSCFSFFSSSHILPRLQGAKK